jgi:hypothetical protein
VLLVALLLGVAIGLLLIRRRDDPPPPPAGEDLNRYLYNQAVREAKLRRLQRPE